MANKGPTYGLSLECKRKIEQKFDLERARDLVTWMEAVLGRKLHPDVTTLGSEQDFAAILKDGTALCELMNVINPGSVKGWRKSPYPFKQMENIELFTAACQTYGMLALDVFQVADLYETKAMFSVLNCLHALGSLARKKGFRGPCYGVKLADKNERTFSEEQMKESKRVIPMQAGSNMHPSQAGMTPYGQGRQIVSSAPDVAGSDPNTEGQGVISLQYGTNRLASQSGMTPYGLGRQILLSSGSGSSSSTSNTAVVPIIDSDMRTGDVGGGGGGENNGLESEGGEENNACGDTMVKGETQVTLNGAAENDDVFAERLT